MIHDDAKLRKEDYNRRMFGQGVRAQFHLARFEWLFAQLPKRGIKECTVFELGCHDGKTLEYFQDFGIRVTRYLGMDMNDHGGIESAHKKWSDHREFRFEIGSQASHIPSDSGPFDVTICMETFEHIPEQTVEGYLERLRSVVAGYFFITVPIERGIPFLTKYIARPLIAKENWGMSRAAVWWHLVGKPTKVPHDGHIGFDDRRLVRQVRKYFNIESLWGIGPRIPTRLISFQRGIIAVPKR